MQKLLHSSGLSRYPALPLAPQLHTAQPGPLPSHKAAHKAASQSRGSLSLVTAFVSEAGTCPVGSVGTAFLVVETEQDLSRSTVRYLPLSCSS